MELAPEDVKKLNGSVQQILKKSAYTREELLCEVRDLVLMCVQPGTARSS
jgi:hypothetical protein